MSVKPISPSEAKAAKPSVIPREVLEAFNECITQRLAGNKAYVNQEEVLALIIVKLRQNRHTDRLDSEVRSLIFANGWLDIEDIYRAQGWRVQYEKPGYNETGEAFFTFSC